MIYLKLKKYKFVYGLTTPRCLRIWSDLVDLKYLGKKVSQTKSHPCAKWVFNTHQATHPSELAGLIETFLTAMLNTTNLNDKTFSAKWVRGTC